MDYLKAYLDWGSVTFAYPIAFLLFLLLPVMIYWQWRRKKLAHPAFRLTTISGLAHIKPSLRTKLRRVLPVLRILALSCLIVALARPQSSSVSENVDSEGIDIVIAMDVSGSMLAEDFKPNRIEATKKLAAEFVEGRPGDRIGMVVFAGEAFTQCPVTIDHRVLLEQIAAVQSGDLADGTAIGDGLATAVDRLRSSSGKSKVVILLTDGVNNSGKIGPELALEIAKTYHVKVYSIGVGTQGSAPYSVKTPYGVQHTMMPVEIDEPLLRKIAEQTGGEYYRATNNSSLKNIYSKIDKLEKTKVQVSSYKHYAELYFPFALLAIFFISVEMLLRWTVYRSVTD
ncbi:MAG: VWA domain-containing protein [Bacteroidetes bacterium]|nr:VWA domain-containing protein [Bacteroidota bacterium]